MTPKQSSNPPFWNLYEFFFHIRTSPQDEELGYKIPLGQGTLITLAAGQAKCYSVIQKKEVLRKGFEGIYVKLVFFLNNYIFILYFIKFLKLRQAMRDDING